MSLYDKTIFTTLNAVTCCECGVMFGIEAAYQAELRNSGKGFYCINGHPLSYPKEASEAFKLRRDLEEQKRVIAYEQDRIKRLQHEVKAEKIKTRAQKGAKTRVLNRIKAGVCPCCNRTFVNLKWHMESKHPEMKPEQYLPA